MTLTNKRLHVEDDHVFMVLTDYAHDDPLRFPELLLETLRDGLDLGAASLYLYQDTSGIAVLRAQVGLMHNDDDPASAPNANEIEKTSGPETPVLAPAPLAWHLGRERPVDDSISIGTAIRVPLGLTGTNGLRAAKYGAPNPFGVMCLYPSGAVDSTTRHALEDTVAKYAQLIARLYLGSIDRIVAVIGDKTVRQVAFRRDMGSLTHSYLKLVRSELAVEIAALWTLDPRRMLLYRRGVAPAGRLTSANGVEPLTVDSPSLVAECFRSSVMINEDGQGPLALDEITPKEQDYVRNWAAVPVKLPQNARLRGRYVSAGGVIELVNHFTTIGGVRYLSALSWDDAYLARSSAELLAALVYQLLRTRDHESDYERLMHGTKTSLQAARSNLQMLDRLKVEEHLPQPAQHFLPNAISWLEDLEAQIGRADLVNYGKLQLDTISLFGDVLAKLVVMAHRQNARDPVRAIRLEGIAELASEFRRVPKVAANRQALDCVFRNLLDNSRKYCRPPYGAEPTVRITVGTENAGSEVVILVSDNGCPLIEEEIHLIFEDGYRGSVAQGVQPQGVGHGLYDCKSLMQQMGGDIALVRTTEGVTFRLVLRAARQGRR